MKKVIVSVLLAVFAAIPTAADSRTSVHALPFGAAANASRLDREAAGGKPIVNYRSLFGHHPHGLDPNKTAQIVNFFLAP